MPGEFNRDKVASANKERIGKIEAVEAESAAEQKARLKGNERLKREADARAEILSPENIAASKSRDDVGIAEAQDKAESRFKGKNVDGGIRNYNAPPVDNRSRDSAPMQPVNQTDEMQPIGGNDWTKDIPDLPAPKKKGLWARITGKAA